MYTVSVTPNRTPCAVAAATVLSTSSTRVRFLQTFNDKENTLLNSLSPSFPYFGSPPHASVIPNDNEHEKINIIGTVNQPLLFTLLDERTLNSSG